MTTGHRYNTAILCFRPVLILANLFSLWHNKRSNYGTTVVVHWQQVVTGPSPTQVSLLAWSWHSFYFLVQRSGCLNSKCTVLLSWGSGNWLCYWCKCTTLLKGNTDDTLALHVMPKIQPFLFKKLSTTIYNHASGTVIIFPLPLNKLN